MTAVVYYLPSCIVTFDIASGEATHQYSYLLTTGTGVSEILALNNHEFLVDERDGHGRANGDDAVVKQLFKIDLRNAVDISSMDATTALPNAVSKTLFLDIVQALIANGFTAGNIPAKIEGISFGPDVSVGKSKVHTLWVANDNDFLETVPDASGNDLPNDNQFFVFGFHRRGSRRVRLRPATSEVAVLEFAPEARGKAALIYECGLD